MKQYDIKIICAEDFADKGVEVLEHITETLDEEMRKFTDMVAKHLADGFDSPCNYSPLDEEMFDYCGGIDGECECDDAVECWKRVFKMWRKQDGEEAERRWDEE